MEFKDSQAIYLQISDYMGEQILLDRWHPGDRIPSVRELAVALQVNPNTVMRTYDLMQNLEIIFNRRGVGYFVTADARNKILAFRRKEFLETSLPEFFKKMEILSMTMEDLTKQYDTFKNKDQ